jgi:hypothetical protein
MNAQLRAHTIGCGHSKWQRCEAIHTHFYLLVASVAERRKPQTKLRRELLFGATS